jgi:hypothetical protein
MIPFSLCYTPGCYKPACILVFPFWDLLIPVSEQIWSAEFLDWLPRFRRVWNLRLEASHLLHFDPVRTTECAPAIPEPHELAAMHLTVSVSASGEGSPATATSWNTACSHSRSDVRTRMGVYG